MSAHCYLVPVDENGEELGSDAWPWPVISLYPDDDDGDRDLGEWPLLVPWEFIEGEATPIEPQLYVEFIVDRTLEYAQHEVAALQQYPMRDIVVDDEAAKGE